jgi:hypothetical protein
VTSQTLPEPSGARFNARYACTGLATGVIFYYATSNPAVIISKAVFGTIIGGFFPHSRLATRFTGALLGGFALMPIGFFVALALRPHSGDQLIALTEPWTGVGVVLGAMFVMKVRGTRLAKIILGASQGYLIFAFLRLVPRLLMTSPDQRASRWHRIFSNHHAYEIYLLEAVLPVIIATILGALVGAFLRDGETSSATLGLTIGCEAGYTISLQVTGLSGSPSAIPVIVGGVLGFAIGSPSWVRSFFTLLVGLWRALRQRPLVIAWFLRGPAFLATKLVESAAEIAGPERFHEEFQATLEDTHGKLLALRRLWCALSIFANAVRIRREYTRKR